ncbi:MAG: glycerophosphodiester phosphodiesterase family protein [Clostridia bacterium]|nr:glycerophosphodiester phosphodiesterase family protein [Clostridia bacterium]
MDFNKSIFENRKEKGAPLLVAHRGVCGANIPCNSITAYKIALEQGADVVEIDVARSKDGELFVFHPGMEHVFLRSDKQIKDMTADEVKKLRLYNQDAVITSHHVPTLKEVFQLLKDKVYINVDKYWTDIEGISKVIYDAGVEKQVIVKAYPDENVARLLATHAPDLMFMSMAWGEDKVTDMMQKQGINLIGAEVLFNTEECPVCQKEYIEKMHEKGLLVWVNSIIYNEADVISAHHTDDRALGGDIEGGWGWLLDQGFDFIQTDWLLMLKDYIEKR